MKGRPHILYISILASWHFALAQRSRPLPLLRPPMRSYLWCDLSLLTHERDPLHPITACCSSSYELSKHCMLQRKLHGSLAVKSSNTNRFTGPNSIRFDDNGSSKATNPPIPCASLHSFDIKKYLTSGLLLLEDAILVRWLSCPVEILEFCGLRLR